MTIGANSFRVIGVVQTMEFTGRILLPAAFFNAYEEELYGYRLVIQSNQVETALQGVREHLPLCRISVETGEAHFQSGVASIAQLIILVGGVCLCAFVYALFSAYCVFSARLRASQRSLGIRWMLGATMKQLVAQISLELLALSLCAIVVVFCLEPLVYSLVHATINHVFGWPTALFLVVCACVSSQCMASRMVKQLTKKGILPLLAGGAAA